MPRKILALILLAIFALLVGCTTSPDEPAVALDASTPTGTTPNITDPVDTTPEPENPTETNPPTTESPTTETTTNTPTTEPATESPTSEPTDPPPTESTPTYPETSPVKDFEYVVNDDGSITITMYVGSGVDVVIPTEIEGKNITAIGNAAFWECTSLTNITLPNNITSISDYAFAYCNSLTRINIPDSITRIGEGAFFGCHSILEETKGKILQISNEAFIYRYHGGEYR